MSLWIKICGNTSLADAVLAAEAGADAVGFVFAPSPRQVRVRQVATITPKLPVSTEKIGVFVNAGFEEIASAVRVCGLTGVQLHFDAPHDLSARLRQRFGTGLRILRLVHFGFEPAPGAQQLGADPNADAVLVDSRTSKAVGGTGIAFDWQAARATLFRNRESSKLRFIVAGGLTPANIAEAIAILGPWGVDVASGVESVPGHKDSAKLRAFITNARAAGGK